MCAQRERFRILGAESGDQLAPQQPAGPEFGDLHEEVHPDTPEERQPGGERIDVQTGVQSRLEVVDAVGQGVGELEIRCGSGFLDVVARDRNGIELRHVRAGVGEDIGDDPHRRLRRIDVGIADHELLEDVVLDGPGEFLRRHALLLGGNHVQREDGQHRAVHGHRHRYRRQVDPVEQFAHVEDGVDGHPGHPDIALHPGMIGVVPAVGGQVERHRQPLLAGGEVAPVERVGVGGGGEPRVLTDGPRLVDVHRRVRTADERRLARETVQWVAGGHHRITVRADVERLDDDALRGVPVQLLGRVAVGARRRLDMVGRRGRGRRGRWVVAEQWDAAVQWDVGEARHDGMAGPGLGTGHVKPPIGSTAPTVLAPHQFSRSDSHPAGRRPEHRPPPSPARPDR